jgi:hypothetical protein
MHQEPDVVARAHAEVTEGVGQAGRAVVEVAVGQPALAANERLPPGPCVGRRLEQVGDVERRYGSSLPWRL